MSRALLVHLILFTIVWNASSLPVASQQNTGQGDDNSPVKSVPARILLGSLPYGSEGGSVFIRKLTVRGFPAKTSLSDIDLSHANGVQIIARHNISDGVVLTLSIDAQEFSKNQFYGRFVKKIIRIETSSLVQPQLVVPVIGWVDQNETSRNFKNFVFRGRERWNGCWGTPNIAGSLLASIILLLLGGMAWVCTVWSRGMRWITIVIMGLLVTDTLFLLILLAFTYSRGAWFAFMLGAVVMIPYSGCLRRQAVSALIAFGSILLFLPSGLERIDSFTQIEHDISVANRFKLWTGALQMMAEHPFVGVGLNRFGPIFEQSYQQFDHTAENSTAVSDYFTLGAERGVPLLGVCVGLLLAVVFESFRNAIRCGNVFQMILTSMMTAILTASAFSSLWTVSAFEWIFIMTLLNLLCILIVQTLKNENWTSQAQSLIVRILNVQLWSVIIIAFISSASLLLLPTAMHDLTMQLPDKTQMFCHVVEPRWKTSKGTIIYFSENDMDPNLLYHSTLRPLAALGWEIVWNPSIRKEAEGQALVASIAQFKGKKIFVAGDGSGGKIAWLASIAMPEKVNKGAGYGFLTSDLEKSQVSSVNGRPFLVIQSLYDDHTSANSSIRTQRGEIFAGAPLKVILTQDNGGRFSAGWKDSIHSISTYFATN